MDRRHFITALGATALVPTVGRAVSTASPADLAGDIATLRAALKLHPGLYRYATTVEVDHRIARLGLAFARSATLEERYLLLSRFMATIRCGHSYCNFFNQKRAVASALFDRPTRLPFTFTWLDGRMVVTGDASGRLPRGTEILSLNGTPARAMLTALLPYARADGHNDAKRVALLEVAGTESIEYFDVFHGLIYGPPPLGEHRLRVRWPDGCEAMVAAPAIGLAARRAARTITDPGGNAPIWTWDERDPRSVLLTMPSWAMYNSKWNWRGWLKDRLDSLGRRGLIVDLRDNEGGEDIGDAILARLTETAIPDGGIQRLIRFRRTPAALDHYLDTWDDSFRTLGVDADDLHDGFYRLPENSDSAIAAVAPRIRGRVAVLIGPTNSSATFQFAQRAQRSRIARLFGTPTGGNLRGINGGCFFFVRLPASGLEFDLPLIGSFPPGRPADAGLQPDVTVRTTAADIAAGRDPTLAQARRWANAGWTE